MRLLAALLLAVVLAGCSTGDADPTVSAMDPGAGSATESASSLRVTVAGVKGRTGDQFAAVLYRGAELSGLEGDAVGGFGAVISSDDESVTEVVRQPGDPDAGPFPHVSDAALEVEPGTYTLVLWVDETLTPVSRWVPVNSYVPGDPLEEGADLFGCHMVVDVGDGPVTDIVVPANLHHNGWNVDCETGATIPGSDAAAAVAPRGLDQWEDLPTAMDPVVGLEAGKTVEVTVSGVTGHAGHELAGVLYAGKDLPDLDADALGGFWSIIDGDDVTITEVIRTPSDDLVGRFPFVTDEALTVESGPYTLVVWVDTSLGGVERWVPVNTDGRGLYGCHHTFDVGPDGDTTVTVPVDLHPDGWNVDCVTGATTPGTDASSAVNPSDSS